MTQARKLDEWANAGTVSSIIITLQNDAGEKRASLVMLEDLPNFIRSNYEKNIHAYGRLLYSYGRDSQEGTRTPEKESVPGESIITPNGQDSDAPGEPGQVIEPNSP